MPTLNLKPYLHMLGSPTTRNVRSCSPDRALGLRALLSPFSANLYRKWLVLGAEQGRLGRVRGGPQKVNIGEHFFTGQRFEHGTMIDLGNGRVSAALSGDGSGGGTGGGASLPEVPYMLTLERIQCRGQTQGEVGADELWIRFILSTKPSLQAEAETVSIVNYRNNSMRSGPEQPVDLLLYAGSLPEVFKLSYLAIEVDLEADADQVMNTFTDKVSQHEKLWFNAGSDTVDTILWVNISLNSLGTALCVMDPNPWVHWIGGIAGTAMEVALVSITNWYKSELIGANEIPFLGENLRQESTGELPPGTGDEPIEITVLGSSASEKISLFMHCAFSRCDNGDIREERRFFGIDPQVDYTFTFRHFVGSGAGPVPTRPGGLSVQTQYHYAWNEQHGKSTFIYAENLLTWQSIGESAVGYEVERALNGQPFVKAGTVRARGTGSSTESFADGFVQGTGQVIQYRVRAFNRQLFSEYSDVLTVRLPAPDVPYGLSASTAAVGHGQLQVHVFWMVSSAGDSRYLLERSRDQQAFGLVNEVPAGKPSTVGANYVDTLSNLRPGETVQYRVKAVNEYGEESDYSACLSVVI